jgi:hypothetical protein
LNRTHPRASVRGMRERKVGGGSRAGGEGARAHASSVGKRPLVEPTGGLAANQADAAIAHPAAHVDSTGAAPPDAAPSQQPGGLPRLQLGNGLAIARSSAAAAPAAVPPEVATTLSSAQGAPLQEPEQWSARVGADVTGAHVVTGEGAPQAAAAIGARAFTVGNRVFMGAGNSRIPRSAEPSMRACGSSAEEPRRDDEPTHARPARAWRRPDRDLRPLAVATARGRRFSRMSKAACSFASCFITTRSRRWRCITT